MVPIPEFHDPHGFAGLVRQHYAGVYGIAFFACNRKAP
jgi:hypothetical protein